MSTHAETVGIGPAKIDTYETPVLSEILRQLQASPFAAIKELRCDFHEGVAILRGKVPTFYTRQIAQTLVKNVAGVEQVDDRIVVDAS